jgi:hypothetical protein
MGELIATVGTEAIGQHNKLIQKQPTKDSQFAATNAPLAAISAGKDGEAKISDIFNPNPFAGVKRDRKARKKRRSNSRRDSINWAFQEAFGRDADPEAMKAYDLAIQGKRLNSPEDILNDLKQSAEYKARSSGGFEGHGELSNLGGHGSSSDQSIKRFETPDGVYTIENGVAKFTPSEEVLKAQTQRRELMASLRGQLGAIPEERMAQIDARVDTLKKKLTDKTLPTLEQRLIQRGLGKSSIFAAQVSEAVERIGQEAALFGEDLAERDRQGTLQALNALEAGQSTEAARGLQTTQLAQNALFADKQLKTQTEQNLMNMMLNDKYRQESLALQSDQLGFNQRRQSSQDALMLQDRERADAKQRSDKFGNLTALGGAYLDSRKKKTSASSGITSLANTKGTLTPGGSYSQFDDLYV